MYSAIENCRQYQELMIKHLLFLNKNMKLSFRVIFHRSLPQPKSFTLNIVKFAIKMQTSQSISFLAENFAISFRSQGFSSQNYIFPVLVNFFSDPRKIFSCLRKTIFVVHGKIYELDSSLQNNRLGRDKRKQEHSSQKSMSVLTSQSVHFSNYFPVLIIQSRFCSLI